MKKHYMVYILSALLLAGCAQGGQPAQTEAQTAAQTEQTAEAVTSAAETAAPEEETSQTGLVPVKGESVLPVLYIDCKDKTHGNDFVTDPINGNVSAQMASWTPGFVMPPEPYYEPCTVTLADKDGNITVSGDADVKVRGNWTTSYPKKPLRIKFGEKQSMGINDGAAEKNWVLLSEYKDMSLLRNKAALMMSDGILSPDGYYSADCETVEVMVNGEYWGVYLLADYQQTGSDRVNISKPEKDYQGTDIGYFIEMDGNFFTEEPQKSFTISYNDNAPLIPYDGNGGSGRTISCLSDDDYERKEIGFAIKSDIYSEAQHDFIESYTENVYRIMYHAAYDNESYVFNDDYSDIVPSDITPEEAVRAVVDVDSLADMYIISELTCDADIYWSSFFMSADFGEGGNRKLTFQAPWDFDSGLGNKSRCPDGTGFYAASIVPDVNANEYETCNAWLTVLMYQDWYTDIIRDKWTRAYDSGLFDRTLEMIDNDTSVYKAAYDRNRERWDYEMAKWMIGGELCNRALNCTDQKQAADWLYEWLGNRVQFMNENWHK